MITLADVLGVEIDDRLSWDSHIDKVAKKVTSGIGAIRKIRDLVDRLQKLQNRAARVIMNFRNDIPGPEALNALGWENLVTRRAKTKAKTMFKVLNELAPSPLEKLFEHKRNITQYNLSGSSTSLQLPQSKTEKLKKSFSYDGAKVWNSLSADVRGSATFTIFKTRLLLLRFLGHILTFKLYYR